MGWRGIAPSPPWSSSQKGGAYRYTFTAYPNPRLSAASNDRTVHANGECNGVRSDHRMSSGKR